MGKMLKNKQKLNLYKKKFGNIGGKIGDRQNNIIKMLKIKGKNVSCINVNIIEFKVYNIIAVFFIPSKVLI